MKNAISLTTLLGFAAVLSLTVSAQKGGGGGSSTGCSANVTSTLQDDASFQIQSDGQGDYTTQSNSHKDSVSSILRSDCSWALDTTDSLSRGIAVTLPSSIGPGQPFIGTQIVQAVINSHCYMNPGNNGIDFGTMTSVGQTLICPINVGFYFNRGWYNIAMNPYNWPGTTRALVTCGGLTGGVCNQWTVVPELNPTPAMGQLTLPDCVGCVEGTKIGGLYEVSFSFMIQK